MNLSPRYRKIAGIFLIVIFGLIELLLLFSSILTVLDNGNSAGTLALQSLFVAGIFFFPLWYGVRLYKSAKGEPLPHKLQQTSPAPHPDNESIDAIRIQFKISLADYRKLTFRLSYTTPAVIYLNFIGVFMLIFLLIYGTANWFVFFIVLFLLFLPVAVFRGANTNYKSTKALHENVSYAFMPEAFTASGESFSTTIQWHSLYKVRELNDWILLYTSKQVIMIVPKNAFTSPSEIDAVRQMYGQGRT